MPAPNSAKYNALAQARGEPLATFICPSRRKVIAYPNYLGSQQNTNTATTTVLAHNDYAANGGTNDPCDQSGPSGTSCYTAFPNCDGSTDFFTIRKTFNGVVCQASEVRPPQISDGMGNTFFAGEKYLQPENYYTSKDRGDNNDLLHGHDHDTLRWCGSSSPNAAGWSTSSALAPMRDTPGVAGNGSDAPYNFGSAHSAGLHFVFCDGSVRMINFGIDLTIYACLGCRNDGNVSEDY